jgi:hypothetical protein
MIESISSDQDQFWQGLIDQLTSNRPKPDSRPMIVFIKIDYNLTNMSQFHIDYALNSFKLLIKSHFSLLSPTAKILFSVLYSVIILISLFANLSLVYAFIRFEKLRTFRNVFIINLVIR